MYILSKPDDWKIRIEELVDASEKDGLTVVKNCMKELKDLKYMVYERFRNEHWQFEHTHTVYELPINRKTTGGKSTSGKTTGGKPTDIVSTDILNTEYIKKEYKEKVFLFPKEFDKLVEELGAEWAGRCIDRLSYYKLSKGREYKSDYAAINSWVKDKRLQSRPAVKDTRMKKPHAYGNFNNEIEMYNRYVENDRRPELFEMYGKEYVMGVMARKAQNAKMEAEWIDKQYWRKIENIKPLPPNPWLW